MSQRPSRVALTAMLALGCGSRAADDSNCRKLFEAEERCSIAVPGASAEPRLHEDVHMKTCRARAAHQSAWLADELACSALTSCDAYIVCQNAAFATHVERPKVEQALAQGRFADAWLACTFNADYLSSPSLVRACEPAFARAPGVLTGKDLDEARYRCSGNERMLRAVPALAASCTAIVGGRAPAP